MTDHIGFKWVAEHLNIKPVQPFAVESKVGTSRRTVVNPTREETYSASARPDPTIADHLTFGLKHELVNLEFLARLFAMLDPSVLEAWIRSEPTGAYARRAGFLFEWLTSQTLNVPDTPSGNYVDALDADEFLVAARPRNVQRWRVRDNLPGTRDFCPTIRRTDAVRELEHYDCAAALDSLEVQFGADILMRSAVWLSIKESRASFAIENEEKQVDRVKRFAAVMERRCGQSGDPLALDVLTELQTEILGTATRYGVRQSPVIVGHTHGFDNIVDYIGPPWERTAEFLEGLRQSMARTVGASPVLRASIASFGFVYIHPMSDGNGRISRFLVNDVLRRDRAVPAPFILPISATITNKTQQRAGYDRALETLSRPLMAKYQDHYHFGAAYTCPDGVQTNFYFDAYEDALPAWRYPDLTHQSEYIGDVIRLTIEVEMSKEASYLRDIEHARDSVKNHLEGPNSDIDQIIRSVRENGWKVSNKLAKVFPALAEPELAAAVVSAVRNVFEPVSDPDEEGGEDTVGKAPGM
ncbi:Fic family protein [Massilia varians]|uniref:Fic family protein n=1 Tax=Massilia varians TaxID=457921 RepID=UPI002555B561|nr:Fic family protein [Massilia varians]MDK6079488.1 Fic family protein [Massilia varians]